MNASNPAIDAFIERLPPGRTFGEVIVNRPDAGFDVRHRQDEKTAPDDLELIDPEQLRLRTASDRAGRYRPLRSAPGLRSGWRARADTPAELWHVLNAVYPGAVGDWYAARQGEKPLSYRQFASRQSGMFRNLAKLSDAQARRTAQACCDEKRCLKQRLWPAAESEPLPDRESRQAPVMVCLEPCSLLMELARREFRLGQEPTVALQLPEPEISPILTALETLARSFPENSRVADFSAPTAPHRLALLRERILAQAERKT